MNSSVKGRKEKRRKLLHEQKTTQMYGLFFHPVPSIPQPATAFTAPALFSQDGVVMPNGKTFAFTRCVAVPVVMLELLPRWRACVDVWDHRR